MVIDGNNLPKNIHVVPLGNVYFHFEKSVAKCKFVFHHRIELEREIFEDSVKCNEILLTSQWCPGHENVDEY